MAQFTGATAIADAIACAGYDYTIKVYTGTYTTNVDISIDHLTIQSEDGPYVTSVVAANPNDHVFEVTADYVTISGFSIFGATGDFKAGIYLASNTHHSTISNNRCGYDGDHKNYIGIYLEGSSNNTITSNTANDNNYGICLYDSSNNTIYLNNFTNNTVNVYSVDSTNAWHTPEQITYIYHGNTYTHYLGNYWSDYLGSDSDGDGIGDTPYSIDGDNDNCPLTEPFENYSTVAPLAVGAEVYPPNKLGILAPWVGLALILALAIGWGILSLRRGQAH